MFIQTETIDADTLAFLPGRTVLPSGNAEFPDADSAARSPLARRLFELNGVESISLGTDRISVEKSDDVEWATLKPLILGAVMDHFTAGLPVMADGLPEAAIESDADPEVVKKVKDLIDTRIRPAVRDGNGSVELHSLKGGIAYLKLEGSAFGLLAGIQNMIRHYAPEVTAVRDHRESIPKPGLTGEIGRAVQTLLDQRINPSVAAHGGHISLIDVQDKRVFIRLEGGCQGCGQADVTLKQGIETEIKAAIPDVTHVLDTTDHAEGRNPYYQMAR